MVDESEGYDLKAIGELLLDAFNAEELHGLFFFSQNEILQKVPGEFAKGDSLPAMVRKAVRYCRSQHVLREMLAEVKAANPNAYELYKATSGASLAPARASARGTGVASEEAPKRGLGRIRLWVLIAALVVVVVALAVVVVLLMGEPGSGPYIPTPTRTRSIPSPTRTLSIPTGVFSPMKMLPPGSLLP